MVLVSTPLTVRAQSPRALEIIGHRGAAGLAPENTLASFSRACAIGVSGIELDVHLSADRMLMVHHDYALNPDIARDVFGTWIADSARPLLRNLAAEDIAQYDVGRLRPNADYTARYPAQQPVDGERIPTLDRVIDLFLAECAPSTRLVVEIKSAPTRPELSVSPDSIADRTVALLRARGVVQRAQIISFDWRPLRRVQRIAPEIRTSYLTIESRDFDTIKRDSVNASAWTDGIVVQQHGGSTPRAIVAAGGRNWSPHYRNVNAESLAEARALGLKVYPWTVNDPDVMDALITLGVDGITTDRPDVLRQRLAR